MSIPLLGPGVLRDSVRPHRPRSRPAGRFALSFPGWNGKLRLSRQHRGAVLGRTGAGSRERGRMEPSPPLPPPLSRDVLSAGAARLGTALRDKPAALPWTACGKVSGQCWVAEEGVKEAAGHADTLFGI